jgi:hypothetical protein
MSTSLPASGLPAEKRSGPAAALRCTARGSTNEACIGKLDGRYGMVSVGQWELRLVPGCSTQTDSSSECRNEH